MLMSCQFIGQRLNGCALHRLKLIYMVTGVLARSKPLPADKTRFTSLDLADPFWGIIVEDIFRWIRVKSFITTKFWNTHTLNYKSLIARSSRYSGCLHTLEDYWNGFGMMEITNFPQLLVELHVCIPHFAAQSQIRTTQRTRYQF